MKLKQALTGIIKNEYVICPLVGIALFYINSNLLGLIFRLFPETLALTFGWGPWWLAQPMYVKIVYVGIAAPFIEELIFRLGIYGFLLKRKLPGGLIISSLLFGLYHMVSGWGILKAVNMFFVGLVFGAVFKRYKFKGALISHITNNALAVANMV